MSTHNVSFYEEMAKNIFQLSSNMHLISFPGRCLLRYLKGFSINGLGGVRQNKERQKTEPTFNR